jgi:hypothetical protein
LGIKSIFNSLTSKIQIILGLVIVLAGIYYILTIPEGNNDQTFKTFGMGIIIVGLILIFLPVFNYILAGKDERMLQETIGGQKVQQDVYAKDFENKINPNYDQFKKFLQRSVHFCNECKPTFENKESLDQYGEVLQICDKCLTVCTINVDACHSCGKQFLSFADSIKKISGPNPSFPQKDFVYDTQSK